MEWHDEPAPAARLWWIWVALMVLLLATWLLSFPHMGHWNLIVALIIAVAKAALVLWDYMELRERPKLVRLFAGIGFFWLGIMLVFSFSDFIWRAPEHF